MERTRIILDTNFLMIPGQFKVDIFHELDKIASFPHEICIFKETIDELNKIAEKNTKDKINAKIALMFIKQKNLKILKNSLKKQDFYIDDIILGNVREGDYVCTQDQDLKRLLKKQNIKIIALKSRKYLGYA